MSKPQLVLDAAGVIVTNLSETFWEEISQNSNVAFSDFRSSFKKEIREALWTGSICEEEFWKWLALQCSGVEYDYARGILIKHLKLLPSTNWLPRWSKVADIHLLSNHRHEWLLEPLEPLSLYLKTITISSQVGCCKPDPAIYEIVRLKIKKNRTIYVDDQERNLEPARRIGWTTVLADEEGKWTETVTNLLQE